jgi:hypothetical protein
LRCRGRRTDESDEPGAARGLMDDLAALAIAAACFAFIFLLLYVLERV